VSFRRVVVRAARLNLILVFASAAAWPAGAPTAADLARCAAMTAPDARLACYDSLSAPLVPPAPAAPVAPATPTASAPALPPPSPPPAPTAAVAVPAPAATPAPAAATSVPASTGNTASTAAPADDPQNFGFTRAQVQAHSQSPPPPGLQSIQVHITNVLTDRQGNGYVLLDNGQMWTYQGDDGRMRPGEPVTIKRASLGSYIMVTQSKRSYHVTRQR
jgi:hypothetical protein